MRDIKLIALDLDGTLLNSRKELSPENREALFRAAERGIEIVPATGRLFDGMPEEILNLPFLHYAIAVNGARVLDCRRQETLSRTEIPIEQALEIFDHLRPMPLVYDCYMDDRGWMEQSVWDNLERYVENPFIASMIRRTRLPVEDFEAHIRAMGKPVQKINAFIQDPGLRQRLLEELEQQFPGTAVTSSLPGNIEINHADANKGTALLRLARILGIRPEQTMAFGDGLNDLEMIRAAGIGVAMENGYPELKQAADRVAPDCDSSGVAAVIREILA